MKIALATTTIHVPHVLKLMRKCSNDVRFFVAMDKKSPDDAYALINDMENAGENATTLGEYGKPWKCSEAIGWNSLARRNVAFLEALKWGADVIYSWDNDNLPIDASHFANINKLFEIPHTKIVDGLMWLEGTPLNFNGIKVSGTNTWPQTWFDPGTLLIPATRHRGIPHDLNTYKHASPVTNAKIGVAAGLVIGDPDIDATTRIEKSPDIGAVHLLGQTGIVVDPHTWTVFNSQNTAVIRELIPAWFMMPGVGRHDDIYASLIVQRVARERNLHVHFGPPFTYQQRNEHNLITDLRKEIDGMENVGKLATFLDQIILPGSSVLEDTNIIYSALRHCDFLSVEACDAALLYLEDCAEII